jgi:hypothetical protein
MRRNDSIATKSIRGAHLTSQRMVKVLVGLD